MRDSKKRIIEITLFLSVTILCLSLIWPTIALAFLANIYINGGIIIVLICGFLLVYKNLYDLYAAEGWSEAFRNSETALDQHAQSHYEHETEVNLPTMSAQMVEQAPRLIRPTAMLLFQRTNEVGVLRLNSTGMRAILDGLSIRVDEARETLRYLVGLLVFLGLLGTFWGLMQTVQSVSGVIDGLGGDQTINGGFESLKTGLKSPLSGMGTAFSSSLFGLAGSLLLGFCTLRVGQAQNRFYQDYEEWLSSLTRLSGSSVGEGDSTGMGLAISLLEQTADSTDRLQQILIRSESQQNKLYEHLADLNQRLGTMVESQKIEHELMKKLAEGQLSTRQLLERMNETSHNTDQNTNLKSVEQLLAKLSHELRAGREESTKTIRDELRIIARTINNNMRIQNQEIPTMSKPRTKPQTPQNTTQNTAQNARQEDKEDWMPPTLRATPITKE